MPIKNPPPDTWQPRPPDGGEPVPGNNGINVIQPPGEDDLYARAREAALPPNADRDEEDDDTELHGKLLSLVRDAESSAERYTSFTRKNWSRVYRAFESRHFTDSKYNSPEFAARSKIFRPKTRSAVRKAMASHCAALFSTVDAMTIDPGNESDPNSRAGAGLMQEVINYRLDRTSGRNAIPWFKTCMGAVQDGTLTGLIVSKQNWKLETKQVGEEPMMSVEPASGMPMPMMDEAGMPVMVPTMKTIFDRPDSVLIPAEQVIIDSGADWTDPAQSAAFLILKWPMKIDEVRERENDPRNPWNHLEESQLRSGISDRTSSNSKTIRTAREGGTDRYDQTNQANQYTTIWVNEVFVRTGGEDYTFYCIGDQHFLTDPKPVHEVYPWNDFERPVTIGYASIEAHKIFPMAPAESWQQLQAEINDLANTTLDAVKMSIAPIAKVVRGRQVDLDKLKRRAPGTNILMQDLNDVEFDKPPGVDAGAWQQIERLNNDFDSLAGQFDQASVMSSRSLNETVGGMRLLSGSANALAEYDQRVVHETWTEPTLAQIVRLCQYYEHDETILGLCGERAQLWQKHGVSQITDQLLEAQITLRIDLGVGAGDPQQRLQKFQMAVGAVMPLIQGSPKFASGEYELDVDAAFQEAFGAAGYRDGGKRFLKKNPPKQGPSPAEQLEMEDTKSAIEQKRSAATLNLAKAQTEPMDAQIRVLELISDITGKHMDRQAAAEAQANDHAHSAVEGMQGRDHATGLAKEKAAQAGAKGAKAPAGAQSKPGGDGPAPGQDVQLLRGPDGQIAGAHIVRNGRALLVRFKRGKGGRITGYQVLDGGGGLPGQAPQAPAGPAPIALPPPNLHALAAPGPAGPGIQLPPGQ